LGDDNRCCRVGIIIIVVVVVVVFFRKGVTAAAVMTVVATMSTMGSYRRRIGSRGDGDDGCGCDGRC
jgi:hypothetical protein